MIWDLPSVYLPDCRKNVQKGLDLNPPVDLHRSTMVCFCLIGGSCSHLSGCFCLQSDIRKFNWHTCVVRTDSDSTAPLNELFIVVSLKIATNI